VAFRPRLEERGPLEASWFSRDATHLPQTHGFAGLITMRGKA